MDLALIKKKHSKKRKNTISYKQARKKVGTIDVISVAFCLLILVVSFELLRLTLPCDDLNALPAVVLS